MRPWLISFVFVLAFLCVGAHAAEPPKIELLVQAMTGPDSAIADFYRRRHFAPAWRPDDAIILTETLRRAGDEGLEPGNYLPVTGSEASGRDIGLTRAALSYLRDVREGRPFLRALDPDVGLPDNSYDAAAGLNEAIESHSLAAYLLLAPPSDPQYVQLRSALARYRAVQSRGGWQTISPQEALGSDGAMTARLRERLAIEDSTPTTGEDLAAPLKRFQGRHGLVSDGKLGPLTLAALNVTAETRVSQILANMERWRWLPRTLEADRLVVNVPDESLSLILGGREILTSRVVIGKPGTPTPILRAEGGGITINPPWNVPLSIARAEILPKLKVNRFYLQSQDMILLNGPEGDPYGLRVRWRDISPDHFPYLIQQHPGVRNPLGTIKFELPNRFDVYLHDTPVKSTFSRPDRAVSHGCVRVERILPLASYALTQNLETMKTIADAVSAGETQYLPLRRRLPVYFLYWTAFTANDGVLEFRPDIYGRDSRMAAALSGMAAIGVNYSNCSRG